MNFDNVEVKGGYEAKYIKPGVEVLKFTSITSGAALSGTPFVEITAEDKAGLALSTRFYFAEGKNMEISVQTLYAFIAATNGYDLSNDADKTKVKATIGNFADYADLAKKLSTVLVGKSLAMVVKGEYITNKDVTKDSWVKAVMSSTVTKADKADTLKYDAAKHIKGTFVAGQKDGVSEPTAAPSW